MKIKTEQDYIDELLEAYPVMPREEMEQLVKAGTKALVLYLRKTTVRRPAGIRLGTKSILLDGRMANFTITPSHSKKSFIIKREGLRSQALRKAKKDRNESENK
jgi:hypothetical protein